MAVLLSVSTKQAILTGIVVLREILLCPVEMMHVRFLFVWMVNTEGVACAAMSCLN